MILQVYSKLAVLSQFLVTWRSNYHGESLKELSCLKCLEWEYRHLSGELATNF